MRRLIRAASAGIAAAALLSACGGNGFLGTQRYSDGNIVITDVTTGTAITSSLADPFVDGTPAFTVSLSETYFDGPYTATMVKWNNAFDLPCFTPTAVAGTTATEFLINSTNANAPGVTTANPCTSNNQDEEAVEFSDTKGHNAFLYFTF